MVKGTLQWNQIIVTVLLYINFGWDCLFLKTKKNTARKRKSYNIHFTVAGSGERGFFSRSRKKLVTDPGMQSVLNKALVQWSNDKLLFQVWILIRWKGMQKRRVMEALNAEDILVHSPGQLDQDPKPGWRCKKKGVDGETRVIKLKPFLPDQWLWKSEVGGKKLHFKWVLCPELTLQLKAWWSLELGCWLCHWVPWHNSTSAAARSGDIRRAQVQTLLKKPLRDPYLLATAVVCLQTSILSLQFIWLIRFVFAVVRLSSFCSVNFLGWLCPVEWWHCGGRWVAAGAGI